MNNSQVWFVTGSSKGFGLELVTLLLKKGYRVVATTRKKESLDELHAAYPNHLLPLSMEVTVASSVEQAFYAAIMHFGQVDVVVNNAGYGLMGTMEEFSADEIKNCFDVNVFGVINVCKAILPSMRERKTGTILNIASVSGSVASPSTGIYSATKAAVIQLSEALAQEVAEFGIQVVAICPGGFRTDFLDKSSMAVAKHPIDAYTQVRQVIDLYISRNKLQGGNPTKAAAAMVSLVESPITDTRVYLGSDALRMMDRKLTAIQTGIQNNQALSMSTDIQN